MTTRRRSALLAASVLALATTLSGCTASDGSEAGTASAAGEASTADAPPSSSATPDVAPAGTTLDDLASLGAEQLVAALESTPVADRRTDLLASVRTDAVLLSDGSGERTVPIPDGTHYLSVAPYVTTTHDCFFHSLTTCRGELGGQQVTVRVVDDATGEVLIDEARSLEDNGFAGFWLPSDRTATVTVTAGGRSGSAVVSTGSDDLTCLTDLRLT